MAFKTNDGKIKYSECTLKNPVINNFITKLLIGHNIEEDTEILLKDMKECFFWGGYKKSYNCCNKGCTENLFSE